MSFVGQTIRWHRINKGMTQEELVQDICSSAYLSKLENNQVSLNKEILSRLCERLGLKVDRFINTPDPQLKADLESWTKALHTSDLNRSQIIYNQLGSNQREVISVELSYIYELALFGHYLFDGHYDKIDEQFDYINSFSWILIDHYPYTYHKFVGYYFLLKSYPENALKHFQKAEEVMTDTIDAELFLMISVTYSNMGRILQSNKYAQQAFQHFQVELNYTRIIYCQIVMGLNYTQTGDFPSAESYFKKLKDIDMSHVPQNIIAKIHFSHGYLHINKGEFAEAEVGLKQTLDLPVDHHVILVGLYYLTVACIYQNAKEEAIDAARQGLEAANKYGNKSFQYKFQVFLMYLKDEKSELIDYIEKEIIPHFRSLGEEAELQRYHLILGSMLYNLNRYKRASEHLLKVRQVNRTRQDMIGPSISNEHPWIFL